MLIDHLHRITEFKSIAPAELRALSERSQVLCIPGKRWLVQPGHEVQGHFYLLKGALETTYPAGLLKSSSVGALTHFYPGCGGARTRQASQVLRIDSRHREFLLTAHEGVATGDGDLPRWLEKFLTSDMMGALQPRQWRSVLQAFTASDLDAGERLVHQGDEARCCFVLEQGHAVVHRGTTTLAHLSPGDFFGEDALIVDGVRNADITTLEPVRVQRIDKETFSRLLLDQLVQFVKRHVCLQGVLLNVGAGRIRGALPLSLVNLREQMAGFDPRLNYLVAGGRRRERALCAFLLAQRGMRAYPLE